MKLNQYQNVCRDNVLIIDYYISPDNQCCYKRLMVEIKSYYNLKTSLELTDMIWQNVYFSF